MTEINKERIERAAKAHDLAMSGCGCDEDTEEGCPNLNGGRCTYAESMIVRALTDAKRRGLEAARSACGAVAEQCTSKLGYNASRLCIAAIDDLIAELGE